MRRSKMLAALGFAVALLGCKASATTYRVVELGSMELQPTAINAEGQVAGWAGNAASRGYLWTPNAGWQPGLDGQYGRLDVLWVSKVTTRSGGTYSSDTCGMNDSGSVVGQYAAAAILWPNPNQAVQLTSFGQMSDAFDVNNAGEVVGYGGNSWQSANHAFLYKDGKTYDLGKAHRMYASRALAINEAGKILGVDWNVANFLWTPQVPNGTTGTLQYLTDPDFHASALNEAGDPLIIGWKDEAVTMVGTTLTYNGTFHRPYTWDWTRGAVPLKTPSGNYGTVEALALNSATPPQIVGHGWRYTEKETHDGWTADIRALLWQNGTVIDLNDAIDQTMNPGWVVAHAWGINDSGCIICTGLKNGQGGPCMLVPQPEPQ